MSHARQEVNGLENVSWSLVCRLPLVAPTAFLRVCHRVIAGRAGGLSLLTTSPGECLLL